MDPYAIYGPPGTGKTASLSRQVGRAVEKFGKSVLVCSYTRAAATEIASRVKLPRENVGTLHAVCYRALGHPQLTAKKLKTFVEGNPAWRLSGTDGDMDDPYREKGGATPGDLAMAHMDLLRARMVPRVGWPASVQAFAKSWDDWKNACGLMDFTDLLEVCLRDSETAPGAPAIGFADEVQDSPKLQLALLWKWGQRMQKLVCALDDDQAIYAWCGATPDGFFDLPIPEANKLFLRQSYRVPAAVHGLALSWVKHLSRRQEKEYLPRREVGEDDGLGDVVEGEVKSLPYTFKYPEPLIGAIQPYLDAGKSVMFLGSCSYMIDPLKAVLRREGIPFHNPYRTKRGDWNPLMPGSAKKTMPVDRVLAFLRMDRETWPVPEAEAALVDPDEWAVPEEAETPPPPAWTWNDVRLWAGVLQAKGVLRRGAKEWLESLKGNAEPFSAWELGRWLEDGAREELGDLFFNSPSDIQAALTWWLSRCLADKRKSLEFPVRVAGLRGGSALRKRPQITVGSIHSVKGGEAQVVVLFPDLSPSGMREWTGPREDQDSIIRLFYVAITRTKETLIICRPASCQCVNLGA
jgi:DNA helicase-2/ATP-dependent DNA helicase PcrA